MDNHPDVCGVVYKLTSNNNTWKEFARLTTKGDPMTSGEQRHWAVSIEESIIFTGRFNNRDDEGVGKVFLHQLPNGQN